MKAVLTVFELIPTVMRVRFFVVLGLAVVVALLEVLGVASIMPFVAMLTDADILKRTVSANLFVKFLSVDSAFLHVHVIGLVVLALFFVTNMASLLSTWLSIRFSAALGIVISRNLTASYLNKGFLFLQQQGASVLANDVTREVEKLAACSVLQLCFLVAKLVQIVFIGALLIAVSPKYMVLFSIGAISLYVVFYLASRKHVNRAGKDSIFAVDASSRRAHELFAARRDVLVGGYGDYFISRISEASNRYLSADAVSRIAPVIPKYVIEITAFSVLMTIPIYLSFIGQDYKSVVPVITLFAYAGYRMLPALQQFYSSYSLIKFYDPLARRVADAINSRDDTACVRSDVVVEFVDALHFEGVCYCYPGQPVAALQDLCLSISKGDRVAFIGSSGAGKSTLIDIILGLLPIGAGEVRLGEAVITDKCIPWGKGVISYVPQSPVLIEATIAENIALGQSLEQIDLSRCQTVAKTACLDEVVARLPQGYLTVVGGAISLSGGEIQRVAIARALYRRSAFLIMDEPTSSLDPIITNRLFDNLCALNQSQGLIVITHDWDLLYRFDRIHIMDSGRIVAIGSPEELNSQIEQLRARFLAEF